MNAPDTIYIPADEPRFSWRSISEKDTDVGYIRADIAFDVASRYESTIEAQKAEIATLASNCNALSFLNQDCKAEIARLTADVDSWKRQALCEANSLTESDQGISRLREALLEHGNHKRNCQENDEGDDCTCGFTAAAKGER